MIRWSLLLLLSSACAAAAPTLILHGGKVVTVDPAFRVATAIAVEGERIVAVGDDAAMLKLQDSGTKIVDLKGRMVLPGLMDSHAHPVSAATHEFDHEVPD